MAGPATSTSEIPPEGFFGRVGAGRAGPATSISEIPPEGFFGRVGAGRAGPATCEPATPAWPEALAGREVPAVANSRTTSVRIPVRITLFMVRISLESKIWGWQIVEMGEQVRFLGKIKLHFFLPSIDFWQSRSQSPDYCP